jgi:hypothetical protein
VTTLAWLQLVILHPAYPTGTATLDIDQVLLAATLPVSGTARQLTRTIDPGGSVPAKGTIKVEHATAGLGQAIVFTHPSTGGYSPPLRQWLTATSSSRSPMRLDGVGFHALHDTGATEYSIPHGGPDGRRAALGALMLTPLPGPRSSGPPTVGGGVHGRRPARGSTSLTSRPRTLAVVPSARLTLPTAETTRARAAVRIASRCRPATVATVSLDEAWLFAMDRGRLTVVDCGAGTPTPGRSEPPGISAPSLDRSPLGSIDRDPLTGD